MEDVPVPALKANEQSDTDAIAEYEVPSELTNNERPADSPPITSTINDESALIISKKAKRYATDQRPLRLLLIILCLHSINPLVLPAQNMPVSPVAASMALDEPATPAPSDTNISLATTPIHSQLTPAAHSDDIDMIL